MADQQDDKKDQQNEDGSSAKKSKKTLFLIVGVLVLLLAGGGAYFFLFSSSDSSNKETSSEENAKESSDSVSDKVEEKSEEKKDEKKESSSTEKSAESSNSGSLLDKITGGTKSAEFGDTINLKPFNINLGNPLENRYVRLELSFEYKGRDSQRQEIERRMPQLRDAIISVTGKKSREFLLSADGKDQLRKELLIVVNRYMSRPIEAVYITDILID